MAYKRTVRPKKEEVVQETVLDESPNRPELPLPAPDDKALVTTSTVEEAAPLPEAPSDGKEPNPILIDLSNLGAPNGCYIEGRFDSPGQLINLLLDHCTEGGKAAIIQQICPSVKATLGFVTPDIDTPPLEKVFCGDKDARWIFMSNEIEQREISRQIVTLGLNMEARNPSGCLIQAILYEGARMVSNSITFVPGARVTSTAEGAHLVAVRG